MTLCDANHINHFILAKDTADGDLLISIHTMMVATLTSSWHRVLDTGWMPGSNTSNLTQTFVRLSLQLFGTPSVGDTLESMTLCDADHINHFILAKDTADGELLLHQVASPVHLGSNITTIHLDFHDVCFLLLQLHKFLLGVSDDTNDFAVLLHLLKVLLNTFLALLI